MPEEIPPPNRGRKPVWPFHKMQPGDKEYVEGCTYKAITSARRYWEAKSEMKFTIRREGAGFNVWRTV